MHENVYMDIRTFKQKQRERERDRETERQRQTDRQTGTVTDRVNFQFDK